jgi:hypothetical protein
MSAVPVLLNASELGTHVSETVADELSTGVVEM